LEPIVQGAGAGGMRISSLVFKKGSSFVQPVWNATDCG